MLSFILSASIFPSRNTINCKIYSVNNWFLPLIFSFLYWNGCFCLTLRERNVHNTSTQIFTTAQDKISRCEIRARITFRIWIVRNPSGRTSFRTDVLPPVKSQGARRNKCAGPMLSCRGLTDDYAGLYMTRV